MDYFLFTFYNVSSRQKKKFNFLYFQQPYWYTEFIVGLYFLCFFFFFIFAFSHFIFSVFALFFYIFLLFLVWLVLGYILLPNLLVLDKNNMIYILFFYIYCFLGSFFDYHNGCFFGFLCNFVFWYFRAMNVPFSFLLKVRYSYERICFYILCSFCSVISIFVFVPSFISENL